MFPPIESDWITYIQTAVPNNENPCWVDIVGNTQYPAAFYYLYPTPDPNPTEVAFRMRLNGDPLSNNPNVYALKEFVWGVQIEDATNAVLFTILVNASGGVYELQVKDSSSVLIYNVPIVLNSPSQPADNVRVVDAGTHFPCASPIIPDEDYFLDFTLPTSVFGAFNFVSSTYRLCYFTSTQDNAINKDYICGMIINPPAGEPMLCVTKQILTGHGTACTNEEQTRVLLITIYNCGTVPVDDVVLTDTLNGSIVITSPPVFIPNAGVTYNSGTRVVTWDVGTVAAGEIAALTITLTGYFTAPGHYVLDSGVVNGTDLDEITFADQGILVYGQDQLTADKQIVSGPLSVEACGISTWTLSVTVANTGVSDIPNVVVTDIFNNDFTIESGPQLTPSAGYAVFTGDEIIWTIDNLAGNSSETLLITVTGFFSAEGHMIFDTGFIPVRCADVTFQDTGVDVLPIPLTNNVQINGDIIDCVTSELLDGVSATVYDNRCKIIGTFIFDERYELSLPAGTYSVLFEKAGYGRKFLSLILLSDFEITADVAMAPKATAIRYDSGSENNADLDLFSGILCEKIDAEIVYSNFICINSRARVECLSDIIDDFTCSIICNSKLKLILNLEKNLVYKLDQEKDFVYDTKTLRLCYPLLSGGECTDKKCYIQAKNVIHCKEENRVYNIAYMKFIAFLMDENDILVNGTALDDC
ncbi:MAG: hypothetical protein AB7C97_00515 [Oscillospiraceae bacterium]